MKRIAFLVFCLLEICCSSTHLLKINEDAIVLDARRGPISIRFKNGDTISVHKAILQYGALQYQLADDSLEVIVPGSQIYHVRQDDRVRGAREGGRFFGILGLATGAYLGYAISGIRFEGYTEPATTYERFRASIKCSLLFGFVGGAVLGFPGGALIGHCNTYYLSDDFFWKSD
ncbi:hypothetical protein KAR48_02580 [bacterium]|nr:hypothetical protein [bacterium]